MPKRVRNYGTRITDTSGRRAAWRKRLPFIIAFVNHEQVEFRWEDESEWTSCYNVAFGYQATGRTGLLRYRIVRNGRTVSPAAYMRSLKVNRVNNNGNGKPKRSVTARFRQFTFD